MCYPVAPNRTADKERGAVCGGSVHSQLPGLSLGGSVMCPLWSFPIHYENPLVLRYFWTFSGSQHKPKRRPLQLPPLLTLYKTLVANVE